MAPTARSLTVLGRPCLILTRSAPDWPSRIASRQLPRLHQPAPVRLLLLLARQRFQVPFTLASPSAWGRPRSGWGSGKRATCAQCRRLENILGLCGTVVEASFCTRCSSVHYDFCRPQHTSFAACETCDLSGYNYMFLFPYFHRNSALHPTTSPHRARLLAPCLLPRIYTGCRYTSATCS